ncbi:class I SAM-dependent DNA methyltransferase [Halomicronema sp. CCY15110]|uniref:class I SAM-dependent DNA methyltransferase n=1 Tax=Halomicronema sp. CCY15110 TaxID=2767773 RepID=UPI001950B8B7|nr:class I SAM-dependent DNA methyltransferase [Halomicronema sp. CCY15110]
MDDAAKQRIDAFVKKWENSGGNERANYQGFFLDLCAALGVETPPPKGNVADDPYCFDKDIKVYHPSGKVTSGFVDFYKADHFIIEAKQGSDQTGKGTAKRGTPSYLKAMEKAFVQAIAYTRNVPTKPPFLLTCDIGSHFELWTGFNGDYGGYAAREDIELSALRQEAVFNLFVDIFTDPQKRNPEKIAARVTREVAADLANLTKTLEGQHEPQEVAHFLMRCIFTMFAEDVKLLKEELFTTALKERWCEHPKSFKPEVEALWQAMNEGGSFGFHGQLLRFNGGLFADPIAFDLSADQIQILLKAAERDWQNVEPAIFGTLLERALDTKERSKLGAHYTPRSYVERLVRPVVMEPLQAQWVVVQGEAKQQLGDDPTPAKKKKAIATLEAFLTELRHTRILDPACGTGNFLYVTLDLMKQLESEVLKRLEDITGQAQLKLDFNQVNPSQFLGIEINPRAAAIADLVIWIGYLQWHFRRFGDLPPVEPVLREYHNIECRDAVLAYDGKEEDVDPATGQVRTRWGGRKLRHPVTGEEVPDPSDQIPIYRYLNPRPAEWPEADYVVSNPPFVGNRDMREIFGDGYAETLRDTYPEVPETVDYVMYWWHKSAIAIEGKVLRYFGLITTNTIRQIRQRKLIEIHQKKKKGIQLFFAIPDHPWDSEGAAVRISMTSGRYADEKALTSCSLGTVINEAKSSTPEDEAENIEIEWKNVGHIFDDLSVGVDISSSIPLKAQAKLCCPGVKPYGSGFILSKDELEGFSEGERVLIKPYMNGRDLTQVSRDAYIIDCYGKSIEEIQAEYPKVYQWLLEKVYPERTVERDQKIKDKWWTFERPRPDLRTAISSLRRYIGTVQTSTAWRKCIYP